LGKNSFIEKPNIHLLAFHLDQGKKRNQEISAYCQAKFHPSIPRPGKGAEKFPMWWGKFWHSFPMSFIFPYKQKISL
jgi:hypothetical protein